MFPVVLAMETAGSGCSAAVTRGPRVLAVERRALRHGHAEVLLPMVQRVTVEAGLTPAQLQIVAVAVGPGGFTGIRVGLSAAQGIALAVGARLVGVSSFAVVAAGVAAARGSGWPGLLVALDSRRDDLYVQIFAAAGAAEAPRPLAAAQALPPGRLAEYAIGVASRFDAFRQPLLIAGDAAEIAAEALAGHLAFVLAPGSAPDALGVAAAAGQQMQDGTDAAPVRPFYLRPPDVTVPKRHDPAAASPR